MSVGQLVGVGGAAVAAPELVFGVTHIPSLVAHAPSTQVHLPLMQEAFLEVSHHSRQLAPVSVGQLLSIGLGVGAAVAAAELVFGVTHIPSLVAHAPSAHVHLPLMQEAFLEVSQVGVNQQVPPVSCEQFEAQARMSMHMHTSA